MIFAVLPRVGRPVPAGRPITARKNEPAANLQNAADEERALQAQQDIVVAVQRSQYDFMTQERAELAREFNDTRAFIIEQTKLDDEILKKYIDMI
ncbi:MAG: hypothetical protein M3M96_03660 [Candidatus Eremiobacteraeota bacterium]|nr:hypothetical protein [Candidatus Eremiobacteraeota bacterium]